MTGSPIPPALDAPMELSAPKRIIAVRGRPRGGRPGMTTTRCREFRSLHEAGCFVIPNPWDAGSARLLAGLGFKALATTSSGFAWTRGRRDGGVPLEDA